MSPIKKIKKRDGRIADFDQEKITEAVWKAANSVGGTDRSLAEQISNQITAVLEVFFKDAEQTPTVEQIQDLVEKILIEGGHAKTAKAYIIYRQKRADERETKELMFGRDGAERTLNFSNNALQVLKRRYLLKDEEGNTKETPEDLVKRVSQSVSKADENYEGENADETEKKFYEMMKNLEFLPNSPTLMNAGTGIGQLSACFVIPVEDSMEGIFTSLKNAALIHKSGGGTGFSFARLRPSDDIVSSTTGVSSGPISFMKVFDAATEVIKQGGKRRGANMGILRVDHPDILDFINMKSDMKTLQNFNISVAVTDKFIEALEKGEEYELLNPRTKNPIKKLPARMVFDLIIANAWKNGDPGVIFIDEVNKKSPVKHLGEIEATNPCGEQPLLPYESCNLGSINLNKTIAISGKDIDWNKLEQIVFSAVHFLDNVIDINNYPIPEIKETSRKTRKIGLGLMGFADVLYQLDIPYNSEEGIKMGERIMRFIDEKSKEKSIELAQTRGVFPGWEGSFYHQNGIKIRNACTTTVAPTGTIGMLAEASGGLEPNFAISFIKNVMDGTELVYTNKFFEKRAKEEGFYSKELMNKIAKVGSIQGFEEIPPHIRRIFVAAQDIAPEWHIKMQAAFQKHVDSSVSKTINFPTEASIKDIENAYLLAHKLKCKGVTIYRDGSRDNQVLNIGKVNKEAERNNVPAQQPQFTPPTTPTQPSIESIQEVPPPPPPVIESSDTPAPPPITSTEPRSHKSLKDEVLETRKCPECKSDVQIGEGCVLCLSCGFSACTV
jgi:ribonucleoside-diphosphate reductase alpha chain